MGELLPEIVLRTLADDLCCGVGDLLEDGVRVTVHEARPLRRRFPMGGPRIEALTLGRGAVVCADRTLYAWAKGALGEMPVGELFCVKGTGVIAAKLAELGLAAYGPSPVYVCSVARRWPVPGGFEVRRLCGKEIEQLYGYPGLRMALSYYTAGDRPDVLATVAYADGELAGVAACSADSDAMWQVGIDVVGAYRGRGLAKALVGDVTAWILEHGKVPYYSTGMANLASQRVAIATGYYPAWTCTVSR